MAEMTAKKDNKMTVLQYTRGLFAVAHFSFKTAPGAVSFKLAGILVNSLLPVATTFFAAGSVNKLTEAYSGAPGSGRVAILYVTATAVLGLLTTLWSSVDRYIQQTLRYRVEAQVSDVMFGHFLSLDYWQYDDKQTADLYDKAKRFSQFYAYVFDRLSTIISQLVTLIFSLIAIFAFIPLMAIAVLIAVIPGVILQFKLSRAQIAHWNKNIDARRARSSIEWNLLQPEAIAELRLNGLVRHLMTLRRKYRERDEGGRLRSEKSFIPKNLLADTLRSATEFGALLWVAIAIINKEQPLGQFVYVQQMVSRALDASSSFIYQLGTIDEDLANLFDYQAFMALPIHSEAGKQLQNAPQSITFDNVSFHYPHSEKYALRDISFTVQAGQHVAIVGENGAGKTTLIKLLAGLYQPTKGVITVDDTPLTDIERPSWHRKLSVLQQDFQHYNFATVRDNVHFGDVDKPFDQELINESFKKAEALGFVNKLVRGQNTYPHTWMEDAEGNKGTNLSGGQWQRLALARNFYRDAPVIVLDEPTSAIDALAEARIFDRLFAKRNNKTVITISHRLSTVEKADLIIVLEQGKIVERGTHTELVKAKGAYWRLFERQIKG